MTESQEMRPGRCTGAGDRDGLAAAGSGAAGCAQAHAVSFARESLFPGRMELMRVEQETR